ncbi:hypothetical protein T4B_7238 [Trichinella pseudospiralis]|uniref:Uncharacterized protein n=1 Tax=Trichinella pseudospiralis TaxID=6337 RepID=A0A0V1GKW7_TRIPS|nr:hypothetical protein T4B_7238 [Trichinella pseudospiralis]
MTPSKSWTAHRRKTDEKSTSVFLENHLYIRPFLNFEISNSDTLRGVLTELIFVMAFSVR